MSVAVINIVMIIYLVPDLDNRNLEEDPDKRKQNDDNL